METENHHIIGPYIEWQRKETLFTPVHLGSVHDANYYMGGGGERNTKDNSNWVFEYYP